MWVTEVLKFFREVSTLEKKHLRLIFKFRKYLHALVTVKIVESVEVCTRHKTCNMQMLESTRFDHSVMALVNLRKLRLAILLELAFTMIILPE